MSKKKPKYDNDPEDWSLPYVIGSGSHSAFTEVPDNDVPVAKRRIGFIRQDVQQDSTKGTGKGKRPTKSRVKKKG